MAVGYDRTKFSVARKLFVPSSELVGLVSSKSWPAAIWTETSTVLNAVLL